MQQQWSAAYLSRCPGVHVNYNSVGSGAGIQQFGQGTVDYAGSDVVMTAAEQQAANGRCGGEPAIHLPVTAGGVAVAYNVSGVGQLKLSAEVLAGIFQGEITHWNDPKIKADNPGTALPDTPIVVFHRSDGSGTTAVFSSYLAAAASDTWKLGSGKTLSWPIGQGAKGNEGVSAGVSQTAGGITYTEQAFAKQKKLPAALIKNAGRAYVELTSAHVSAALQAAQIVGQGHDLSMKIDYQPTAANAYPISTVSYVIVCSSFQNGFSQNKVRALQGYLTYAITTGQQAAEGLGFAALPPAIVDMDAAAIASISAE
jgi:phosphate transport system substrate-binding protein